MTSFPPPPPISAPDARRWSAHAKVILGLALVTLTVLFLVAARWLVGPLPGEIAGSWSDGAATLQLDADGTFESYGIAFYGNSARGSRWSDAWIRRDGTWRIDQSATDEGRGVLLEALTDYTILVIEQRGSEWGLIPIPPSSGAFVKQ